MKLSRYYLSLFAVAALAACSSDDEQAAQQHFGVIANSDVEVRLSAGSGIGTRSSVESDDQGLFSLDSLGIFMLATHKQDVNPNELALDWSYGYNYEEPDLPYTNPWAVWIDNVAVNAVINAEGTRTDINWVDGKQRWYPIGNWYSYRFYGYYPRVEMDQITVTETQRVINYTDLDGTKDIIWGRSAGADMTDAHEKYAYSARYFRQAGYGNVSPEVSFVHKMMRLQFSIQGIADENAEPGHEFDAANTMLIDTIIVERVPTSAWLVVADLNDETNGNDGKIIYDWQYTTKDIGVIGQNDGEFLKVRVNNDDLIKVGQPILLPVIDDDAVAVGYDKYRVKVRLRNVDGVIFDHEKPLELNVNRAYEPGKTYRVAIKIAGPKFVTMSASLKSWEDDNDTDDTNRDSVKSLELD